MNKFFDFLQPTIVKTSNDSELPENLRNRFLLNFNVFGIKYFDQYYLLSETSNGIPYLIIKEDNWGIELENSNDDFDDVLDIPRLYIDITDKFIDGFELFRDFIYQAIMNNPVYGGGTENFVPGVDYWLNTTLYNYLANTNQIEKPNFASRLPNYITQQITISKYFDDLTNSPYKDYTNLIYYNKKNKIRDFKFSEDELNNFYSTFCKVILNDTLIKEEERNTTNNQIYNTVLNYFSNFKSDDASISLNLILNNNFATAKSNTSSCSCNSVFNTSQNIVTESCSSLYSNAMLLYLKQMLGDNNFYCNWFMIKLSETEYVPNDVLITNLQTLINEFLSLELSLDFGVSSTNVHNSNCCKTYDSVNSQQNIKTVNNYLNVLSYVYDDEILANVNKIKIYGEAFGELLPSLQF